MLDDRTYSVSVYIEDTDAFAVVYYANYAKFFERAAHAWVGMPACAELLRERGLQLGIEAMEGVKYAQPATLGDECEVRGRLLALTEGQLALQAALVRCADGKELHSCARCALAFRDRDGELVEWPLPTPPELTAGESGSEAAAEAHGLPDGLAALDLPVILQADEAGSGRLTMHAALRFFERHRTTFIGGPDALADLQAAGVTVVVARMTDARLLPAARGVRTGDELTLRCRVTLKARGTQVLFEQYLLGAATGEPVARAAVTCLCVDPVQGKMVPAPASLQATLRSA